MGWPEGTETLLDPPQPEPSSPAVLHSDVQDLDLPFDRGLEPVSTEPVLENPETSPQMWSLGKDAEHQPTDRPVERPATAAERALAAGIDCGLMLVLYGVIGYFAAKVARVAVIDLSPAAFYLAAFLTFLGLVYAGYFTGSSGQTIGKQLAGLHVVDTSGHAPGVGVALLRAIVGLAGIATLGLGMLPVLFDPARRALHDRLFKTRVVKH